MTEELAERIERTADVAASAVFALAAAYCAFAASHLLPVTAIVAVAAFCCGFVVLGKVRPEDRAFRIGDFANPEIFLELEENDEDDAASPESLTAAELLLDDVLADVEPDSRVVRLFDRDAMPTPGELQARIARHLGSDRALDGAQQASEADASQALHDALAELRRSLR